MYGALQQRSGDPADGDNRQQRHLEAGVEETARAKSQKAERGKADGVQSVALAVDETAKQVKGDHPEGALDRRGEAGKERVGERGKNRKQRGRDARQPEPLCDPEEAAGHDGQVKARDHQHMKRAGALKAHAQLVGQEGAVAGDHGGQHDGVFLGEAQRNGQAAHGSGQGQQAGARGALQADQAAGEKEARDLTKTIHSLDVHRGRGGNALF